MHIQKDKKYSERVKYTSFQLFGPFQPRGGQTVLTSETCGRISLPPTPPGHGVQPYAPCPRPALPSYWTLGAPFPWGHPAIAPPGRDTSPLCLSGEKQLPCLFQEYTTFYLLLREQNIFSGCASTHLFKNKAVNLHLVLLSLTLNSSVLF